MELMRYQSGVYPGHVIMYLGEYILIVEPYLGYLVRVINIKDNIFEVSPWLYNCLSSFVPDLQTFD